MKTIQGLCAILFVCCFINFSCKKSAVTTAANAGGNTTGPGTTDYPTDPDAIITTVGTSAGTPVVQTISPSGGTVSSSDGMLDVIIPSGALINPTPIAIEPVAKELPGSIYNDFSLSPDGQQFQQPVTIQFHYRDQDLDTIDPGGLAVAFQLHDGTWEGFQNSIVDTNNKTVSIQSTHFTGFTMTGTDHLSPGNATVKTSGQVPILHVTNFSRKNSNSDELAPLVNNSSPYGAHSGDVWTVNNLVNGGNGVYGKITPPTGNGPAIYTAPAKVPSPNTVTIMKSYVYRPRKGQISAHEVRARIKILGVPKFQLDVVNAVKDQYVQGVTFKDSSKVIITINPDSTVNVPTDSIFNGPPSVSKDPQTVLDCTYTFVKDPVGPVNITKITGNLKYYASGQYLLTLIVYINEGTGPRWHVVCPNASTTPDHVVPNANGVFTFPFFISFDNPQVQILGDLNGTYARLTPMPN